MRFALPQGRLTTLAFVPLHSGKQALVIATGNESIRDTKPGGQGNHHRHKRPEQLGMLGAVDGVELRADLVEEYLYTLLDEPSLLLILVTKEDITCGFGVPLLYE